MTVKEGNVLTAVWVTGQQVVEEVLDAQGAGCPPEYFNINIEPGHEYHRTAPQLKELPFLRTRYDMTTGFSPNNPRQQVRTAAPAYIIAMLHSRNVKTMSSLI